MRTVLCMIALSISGLSSSILKISGMWEGPSDTVVNFFATVFVVCMVMDIVEFSRRSSK